MEREDDLGVCLVEAPLLEEAHELDDEKTVRRRVEVVHQHRLAFLQGGEEKAQEPDQALRSVGLLLPKPPHGRLVVAGLDGREAVQPFGRHRFKDLRTVLEVLKVDVELAEPSPDHVSGTAEPCERIGIVHGEGQRLQSREKIGEILLFNDRELFQKEVHGRTDPAPTVELVVQGVDEREDLVLRAVMNRLGSEQLFDLLQGGIVGELFVERRELRILDREDEAAVGGEGFRDDAFRVDAQRVRRADAVLPKGHRELRRFAPEFAHEQVGFVAVRVPTVEHGVPQRVGGADEGALAAAVRAVERHRGDEAVARGFADLHERNVLHRAEAGGRAAFGKGERERGFLDRAEVADGEGFEHGRLSRLSAVQAKYPVDTSVHAVKTVSRMTSRMTIGMRVFRKSDLK